MPPPRFVVDIRKIIVYKDKSFNALNSEVLNPTNLFQTHLTPSTDLVPSTMVIVNPSFSIHQCPPWESVGEEAMKGKLPTLQWETNHINELDGVGDFLWVLCPI